MAKPKKESVDFNFRMGDFTTSKLIQNLGINREQFQFIGSFRSIHGRD
tara:strand:+ start:505 stop:648 length:144 start_codon:yes stop_codon:yes gene_type:complete